MLKCKIGGKKLFFPITYRSHSHKSIVREIFLMYVTTIQCLNYIRQEQKKNNYLQFMFLSDTPVTLKQGQGH